MIVGALALLSAWLIWFARAQVTLYEVSERARVEVDQAAAPVEAPVSGPVVRSYLTLGATVRAGDVLADLDASALETQLVGEQASLDALGPQIAAVDSETATREDVLRQMELTERATLAEARARQREADAGARYAREEAARLGQLGQLGQNRGITDLELLRLRTESQRRQAEADQARLSVQRLAQEARGRAGEQRAGLASLSRQRAELAAKAAQIAAAITQLEQQIALRHVRSPISGRLGDVAPLRAGTFVHEGDQIATVVPHGALRVVAEYDPASLGRIRPGQHALVRLRGFPWAEYGMLEATVKGVGGEVRDGTVRVELALRTGAAAHVPMQHGLPGDVEIEVERATPMEMLLRAAGQWLTADASARPAAASPS